MKHLRLELKMNTRKIIAFTFLFVAFLLPILMKAQELSGDESELYSLLMKYRKSKGLPAIPLSGSLTTVAQAHARDLEENYSPDPKCNLHSWSNNGNWVPVCYTKDHAKAELMWSKPRELTNYRGNGYEIAFAEDEAYLANAENALESWKSSKDHNAVMLNRGIWKKKWNAIGIGINGSYAVIWFGNEPDK